MRLARAKAANPTVRPPAVGVTWHSSCRPEHAGHWHPIREHAGPSGILALGMRKWQSELATEFPALPLLLRFFLGATRAGSTERPSAGLSLE